MYTHIHIYTYAYTLKLCTMEYLRAAHWHHFVCLWRAQDPAREHQPRRVVVAASRNTESLVRC